MQVKKKMKRILPILILLIISSKSFGEIQNSASGKCESYALDVIPKSKSISQNPIFLIDYREADYLIFEKLKNVKFCLVDNKGKKIEMEVLQMNKGANSIAQILLKPKRKIKKGREVSIEIHGLELKYDGNKKFNNKVKSKRWKVISKKDKIQPIIKSELKPQYINYLNSSAPGHGIKCNFKFVDNKGDEQISEHQIILEITNDKGKIYLMPTSGKQFWIYDGFCGAAFKLSQDKKYSFKIRVMDMSGNKSAESYQVEFKTEK